MYIYRLVNFKGKPYLFSKSGNLIYDFTRYPFVGLNCKTGDFCSIYYYDYKNQKKRHRKTTIQLKKIDFEAIPDEIKGLFHLYDKDINSIKNSMSLYGWQQFLIKYGENI